MRYDEEYANCAAAVLVSCERHADRAAVVDDGVITYAELGERVLASVRAFMAWGVRPGDRVGLCAANSARWIVAALGIQGAGGVIVPLNARFKGPELSYILGRSGAMGLVAEDATTRAQWLRADGPDLAATVNIVSMESDAWDEFVAGGERVPRAEAAERIAAIGPDDISDILFTSGTTGYPKGVIFTHGQSLRGYGGLGDLFGYRPGDRFLIIPPFFHALGYKSGWFAGLLHGVTVLPERRYDAARMVGRIERERVTMMIGPPTIFADLLSYPDRPDVSSLRLVVPSATGVLPELVRRMRTELGIDEVLTGYGLTEASALVSCARTGDDPDLVADSVGRPLPDVEVLIHGAAGQPAAPGERGEILVRGYNVMRGYWQDDRATAEVMTPDGWLHTGDIGSLDEHGFLRILGRSKDVVLVGGFNVYPAEVERMLAQFPDIAEVSVVGVPDERLGEVGFAFVVPAGAPIAEAELLAWARDRMANFKVPRYVLMVDQLPKNPSMKVLRSDLRGLAVQHLSARL